MAFKAVFHLLLLLSAACNAGARAVGGKPQGVIQPYENAPLQNIVTWDEHSLFVHGERILFYSGEFHPFRLPVPGLWLDVFQKIKAASYSGVSFYTHWALLEGERGTFRADGIFDLEPFFQAAMDAGIYLLARPGPYINAESAGGGFPGWLQRVKGPLRTPAPSYLNATRLYVQEISKIIARAQITNGGPVILLQPENEYTSAVSGIKFPNHQYFKDVEDQYRAGGIVVPFINNDAGPDGNFAPGTGEGAVQIYGHDGYPLGFDCADPTNWPNNYLPTNWHQLHEEQSPTTPYSIVEFQGGSFDPWGGYGFAKCAELLNSQFERVFYKNDFSFGVTIFNIYMTFGGTNWGNLGYPQGYTSYDYGAIIKEDRQVTREKYSEAKLEANFLVAASSAYLTATPGNISTDYTTSSDLVVTPLFGNGTKTNFYVLRHSSYNSLASTNYSLNLPTSQGNLTIPRITGMLTLNGRDSKIHVSDYSVGSQNLLYSTAEIFTYQKYESRTVLIVYGGPGERHELAFTGHLKHNVEEGASDSVQIKNIGDSTTVNWVTSPTRRIVKFGSALYVYLLDRQSAYDYWVLRTPGLQDGAVIARAGYLLRNASITGTTLNLNGDLNSTKPLEVISGAPIGAKNKITTLKFNGKDLSFEISKVGAITSKLVFKKPSIKIPNLASLDWKYHTSLPEISASYSDKLWTLANKPKTQNPYAALMTPTSLFSGDYGYNTGTLVYRGHFTSKGTEKTIQLVTQGGTAFGMSCWLGNKFIGSWIGNSTAESDDSTFALPTASMKEGSKYVLTVVIDNNGYEENYEAGNSGMQSPRGILDYELDGRPKSAISWKITGNLGGEKCRDLARGPLNEGGMYAERQGWHLPKPPSADWKKSSPYQGIDAAGIGFYSASFDLDLPQGYDIPLSFVFKNSTAGNSDYRAQLFVNGYQFGKYINNIGPQEAYPVQEGILNYHGTNYVALTLWAQDVNGAKLAGLELAADGVVESGYGAVPLSPMPAWHKRAGAY